MFSWIFRYVVFSMIRHQREKQMKDLRFLQVKIPMKNILKSVDVEYSETINTMKQNIEVMNQVYKNFYSIYKSSVVDKYISNIFTSKYIVDEYISVELLIEKESIKFIFAVPKKDLENIEKVISWFYAWCVIITIDQPKLLEAWKYMQWWEFALDKYNHAYPLKTYEIFEADPMDSVLSAYNKVQKDEKMCLQIMIMPLHEHRQNYMRFKAKLIKEWRDYNKHIRFFFKLWDWMRWKKKEDLQKDSKLSQSQQSDIDKKMDDEMYAVKIRAFATSPDPKRPDLLIDDLAKTFHQYNYVGMNKFVFRKTPFIKTFAKEFVERLFFTDDTFRNNYRNFNKKTILSIKELSSIIHFPHSKFNKNPRISRQKYKIVPAPDTLPDEWMLIWHNVYGWIKKEIRLKFMDRFRHLYIIWQTWSWKSSFMYTMARDDIKENHGFCFLDPHGDACEYILKYYPKEKIDDLIYFDLANTEYPIWFNPLEIYLTDAEQKKLAEWKLTPEEIELIKTDQMDVVTNDLVEMFVSMYWPEIFGPRIQDYFRNACFLLMSQPEWWTLTEIMRIFTDQAFMESKLRNVKNPVILSWFNKTYKSMGDREKWEIIPFFQAKFGPFITWVYIRNIVWQPKSAFNMYDLMQQGKILLVNLSKWLAWEENSKLVWRLIATQIKLSALKRARIAEKERMPYFLYVDEFQNYVSQAFESIMSEARKYRLWLTMAHQYIDQLKQKWLNGEIDLSKAIFGNVWNIVCLKVWANDGEFLEKEFGPEFSRWDLVNMDKFKWVSKISVDSQVSRPFSLNNLNPYADAPINSPEKVEIIKQISALKYGAKRDLVDKEIYYRIGV